MVRRNDDKLKKELDFSERKRFVLKRLLSQRSPEDDSLIWSMADIMTLLLMFFILYYAQTVSSKETTTRELTEARAALKIEQQAKEKEAAARELTEARVAIKIEQQAKEQEKQRTQEQRVLKNEAEALPAPAQPEVREQASEQPPLEQLRQEVINTLTEKDEENISLRLGQERLALVLGERITFNLGEAEIIQSFVPTLKRISELIASKSGYRVVVSGHTDNRPIKSVRFPSNWELSTSRAVAVAKFLIDNGVDAHRVSVEGYAEHRPVCDNGSEDNRQANRRVEVSLIKEAEKINS